MNRERYQLDKVSIGVGRIGGWGRQRFPFLQVRLRQILESAGYHQPRVLQIESLRHSAREVESLRHHHVPLLSREIKRYVVPKHCFIILLAFHRTQEPRARSSTPASQFTAHPPHRPASLPAAGSSAITAQLLAAAEMN